MSQPNSPVSTVAGRHARECSGSRCLSLVSRVLPDQQAAQERGDQRLQRERTAHDLGAAEAALRQIGLHGHDETRVLGVVEVGRHCERPGGVAWRPALGQEAQDGPEPVQPRRLCNPHRAVRLRHGDDAVSRAEIYADDGGPMMGMLTDMGRG